MPLPRDMVLDIIGGLLPAYREEFGWSRAAVFRVLATQERNPPETDDRMGDVQQLAYDAERWPHCMDLPEQNSR